MDISNRTYLIVVIALAFVLYDIYQSIAFNRVAITINRADMDKYVASDSALGEQQGAQVLANTHAMDKYRYFYA